MYFDRRLNLDTPAEHPHRNPRQQPPRKRSVSLLSGPDAPFCHPEPDRPSRASSREDDIAGGLATSTGPLSDDGGDPVTSLLDDTPNSTPGDRPVGDTQGDAYPYEETPPNWSPDTLAGHPHKSPPLPPNQEPPLERSVSLLSRPDAPFSHPEPFRPSRTGPETLGPAAAGGIQRASTTSSHIAMIDDGYPEEPTPPNATPIPTSCAVPPDTSQLLNHTEGAEQGTEEHKPIESSQMSRQQRRKSHRRKKART
jgi:hypothetical protein